MFTEFRPPSESYTDHISDWDDNAAFRRESGNEKSQSSSRGDLEDVEKRSRVVRDRIQ